MSSLPEDIEHKFSQVFNLFQVLRMSWQHYLFWNGDHVRQLFQNQGPPNPLGIFELKKTISNKVSPLWPFVNSIVGGCRPFSLGAEASLVPRSVDLRDRGAICLPNCCLIKPIPVRRE
jgi:hypothetical protein